MTEKEDTSINTPEPAFDFYEIVTVIQGDANSSAILGERGFIGGRVADDQGRWGYAVYIYSRRECWDVSEEALQSTGKFDERERDRPKRSIRVSIRGELLAGRED